MSEPVPSRVRPPAPRSRSVSKPVLHRRWRRTTLIVTVLGGAVLGAAGFLLFRGQGKDEDVESTWTEMRRIGSALERFHRDHGSLPRRLSDVTGPGSEFRGDIVPEDAYRNPIEYRAIDAARGTYVLRSRGKDRQPGTGDDLTWPQGALWSAAAPEPAAGTDPP